MNIQEQIAVMQHYAAGGKLESSLDGEVWFSCETPHWNWDRFFYRIKKEPRVFRIALHKLGNNRIVDLSTSSNAEYCRRHSDEYEFLTVVEQL